MLADLINITLKQDSNLFTLQELAQLCKYNIPVEIMEQDGSSKLNILFNLEDFLSDLLSLKKCVLDTEADKYARSKSKIIDLIIENTSYE